MFALTLWRPWSDAIIRGPKRIENRTWTPPRDALGRYIAIHGGKRFDDGGGVDLAAMGTGWAPPLEPADSPEGIIGVALLRGWLDLRGLRTATVAQREDQTAALALNGDRWWMGPCGWWLTDPIAIEPVPCRGAQGLWTVPADVAAIVEERARAARRVSA